MHADFCCLLQLFLSLSLSLRSAHSNAYFYGFWKNKRIVLFDTLLEDGIMPPKVAPPTEDETASSEEQTTPTDEKTPPTNEKAEDAGALEENSSVEQPLKDSGGEEQSSKKKRQGCSKEEILAVLAHELGHWKLSHNLKNLTVGEVSFVVSELLCKNKKTPSPCFSSTCCCLCSCLASS